MAKGSSRFGWPRGLRRTEAAEYIGISATKFDEMVSDGRMPKPKQIDARRVWDRHSLDRYFNDLSGDEEINEWDETVTPPHSQGNPDPRDIPDHLQEWYGRIGFDPATMSEEEIPRLRQVAKERWQASIPGTPLGKRERKALEQLVTYGVGVAVNCNEIKDCGPDTQDRLEARGFLETRPREKYPDRIGFYLLTAAGFQAWKEVATVSGE